MQRYLAHIAEDGRGQTVQEHLLGTAKRCAAFAEAFGAREQGELAGKAHDIGKYSQAFQRRILGAPDRVDHATAGAYECFIRQQICAAFAVAGHHGGLPDGGSRTDKEGGTLWARMNGAREGKLPDCAAWKSDIELPSAPRMGGNPLDAMFFTRMLYSCLVDADYLDTETFMAGHALERGGGESIDALYEKLHAYIKPWYPPKGALNAQRCAILDACLGTGAKEPGLFSLTVPTGGGKTVASLAFALAHAKAHGLRRVIYVIPYTSIIEQTARVFRDVLGEENVLEHHCGVLYDIDKEASPEAMRMARATENWDKPVIVTTAVQFFESLHANRSSQCRKLHSIAGSVVIFDEAQMIPLPYLRPCVHAIAQLVKGYRVSAVLCTATQPALAPIFRQFLPDCAITELCPQALRRSPVFRRVRFERAGKLSNDTLAGRMMACPQVLCVVNTRRDAQALYDLLGDEGRYHLSTLMCPADRSAKFDEIRARLSAGLPCRVVSTSLIEAGVDVDFPTVFREEAGLDSILQAAGRCNREGRRAAKESVVYVFKGENPPPKLFDPNIAAYEEAAALHEDIASEDAIRAYFTALHDLLGKEAQDAQGILEVMQRQLLPFKTVAERFHLIESATRAVYIPIGEGEALVERLRGGERNRTLFRQLGQYAVNIYEQHFAALLRAGCLEVLEDGSAILCNAQAHYSAQKGLTLEPESGAALMF